jgi:predicted enzyme related to lactoylglutathione lyase
MPKVVHFEIPADDPERAVKFYKKVFEWEVNKWDGPFDYWLAMTGDDSLPGIHGAIMERGDERGVRITIDVPSLDEFRDKILESGGKQIQPKTTIPGVGHMAMFLDTEGNRFLIMESDVNAEI